MNTKALSCSQRPVRPYYNFPLAKRLSPDFPQILSWSRELADIVRSSDFKPDMVIGIANKGLVPGKIVADNLSVPIHPFKISRHQETLITSEHDVEEKYRSAPQVQNSPDMPVEPGMRLLIVDESINTGQSVISAVQQLLSFVVSDTLIRIAAIADIQTPKIADFWVTGTDCKWYGGHFCSDAVDADYFAWMGANFPSVTVTPKEKL